MLASFRSALLMVAALTVMIIAPAQAGPTAEPVMPATSATLPKVAVPELLDPQGEPTLSQPQATEGQDNNNDQDAAAAVKPSGDLAAMVAQLRGPEAGSRELECLATGIYFESKSEPLAGQLAVGKVIANRAQSGGRFPGTYCGVLFQRGQFSFVHGHALPAVSHLNRQWQTAVAIAKITDKGLKESAVGDALFFHARYVAPGWHMRRVASIGNHVFYR
ncbi:cell wall hydrolase [Sphingomonas agri]|uniref:cell wall hydrolase n=1 Tax=Sphingomonas agri TaxID=1813878 RepID=UPI00311D7676